MGCGKMAPREPKSGGNVLCRRTSIGSRSAAGGAQDWKNMSGAVAELVAKQIAEGRAKKKSKKKDKKKKKEVTRADNGS